MSPPEYDGNGTFREHRLLILDALKRHEDRLNKLERMLWAGLAGIVAILLDLVVPMIVGKF